MMALVVMVMVGAGGGGGGGGWASSTTPNGGSTGSGGTEAAVTTTEVEVDTSRCPVGAIDEVSGPVTVQFWHALSGGNGEVLEQFVQDYHASQDAVRVELTFQGGYQDNRNKFIAGIRAGELPDMVQVDETSVQLMIDSQTTVPIQACVDAAGYDLADHLPAVLDQYSVGEALVSMPFNTSSPVLFYDKATFEAAGLDPETPPTSFAEIRESSQQIVDAGAADAGFVFRVVPWYLEQFPTKAGVDLVDGGNGRTSRATTATFDTPETLATLTWIDDMLADGLASEVGRDPDGSGHFFALADDAAAMTFGSSGALGAIYDFDDLNVLDLGIGQLPEPMVGTTIVSGASLWMVDGDDDAKRAAVWDFMVWLNEAEQQARWHAATGYIPVVASAADDEVVQTLWEERPGYKVAFDQIAAGTPGEAGPSVGAYAEMRETLRTATERIISSDADPAEELRQAQADASDAIANYNERIGE